MSNEHATLAAEISKWPSKTELLNIFKTNGYAVIEGTYSVRLADFDHFIFRDLGGDLGQGTITADHKSTEELADFSGRVSRTLANSGIRHRFEVYSDKEELAAYLHYEWPKDW
ncbi:MAG: hypothetical protein OQK05_13550 [Pseudopelagicola sp.]|nr:hypothetical protein [Pseudopelagicola sp.]